MIGKIKQSEKNVIPACFKRGSIFSGWFLRPWIPAFAGMTIFIIAFCFFIPSAFANVLGNPDFEQPIGNGSGGNWDDTNGAARTVPGDGLYPAGFSVPPSGGAALYLPRATAAYTFQTYDGVKPGDFVVFTAWAESDDAGGASHRLKIEFKRINSDGTDQYINRVVSAGVQLITGGSAPAGGGFQTFSVAGTAPEGTERVVFVLERLEGRRRRDQRALREHFRDQLPGCDNADRASERRGLFPEIRQGERTPCVL